MLMMLSSWPLQSVPAGQQKGVNKKGSVSFFITGQHIAHFLREKNDTAPFLFIPSFAGTTTDKRKSIHGGPVDEPVQWADTVDGQWCACLDLFDGVALAGACRQYYAPGGGSQGGDAE